MKRWRAEMRHSGKEAARSALNRVGLVKSNYKEISGSVLKTELVNGAYMQIDGYMSVCVCVRVRVRVRVCMYERKSVNLCETELINGAYMQACVAAVVCDCCYA